jgi:hypothetical protein
MPDPAYEAAVKATFETKPLRTVLMIDDEFPNLSDLAAGATDATAKRFRQKDLAVALYDAFRKNDMLCDVENVAADVRPELIRKSDLIVLDYHLGPTEGDSEKSVAILRELAASKHFNTVVVYTAEPNLDKVWLEVIASLGGSWTTLPGELEGDAKTHWERLSDERNLPEASLDAVMEFARRRDVRGLSPGVRKAAQDELIALKVPPNACTEIINALIHVELAKRAGRYKGEPKHYAVGDYAGGTRWIQSKNTFITIHKKENDLTDNEKDPAGILACLSSALLSWRPNLIQVVISEIQNILELEALISDDEMLRQPATQAALWHFLLDALGRIDPASSPDVRAPLSALVDRIIEGVRRRLSTDPALLKLAGDTLLGELRDAGWNLENWPEGKKRIAAVAEISRTKDMTKAQDVFFRLNSFLSTEVFRRSHLTIGTLIRHVSSGDCFVVATPACDMTPRPPSNKQLWTSGIHPLKPIVCVHLRLAEKWDSALTEAEHGRHVFLEVGHDKHVFAVSDMDQTSYEIIFAKDAGVVRDSEGRKIFSGGRVASVAAPAVAADTPAQQGIASSLTYDEFEVIGQLRVTNATRLLQAVSQQLSRIGLDFISMPPG